MSSTPPDDRCITTNFAGLEFAGWFGCLVSLKVKTWLLTAAVIDCRGRRLVLMLRLQNRCRICAAIIITASVQKMKSGDTGRHH
jgi:hypothetical protein